MRKIKKTLKSFGGLENMPIFAAVLGQVPTNRSLTAALLASLAQLARARDL